MNGLVESEIVRYKATIAYDGSGFSGFQIQPNGRTVQEEIEKALSEINKTSFTRIHPSGRTDAGVHAKNMVLHFDFPGKIPTEGLFRGLNVLTPNDISFNALERVENDFHARYHAVSKVYSYKVDNNRIKNPFTRNFVLNHPYPLDHIKAQEALDMIVGTHDFTSFCSTKTDKQDKVRTVFEAKVDVDKETNEWVFTFHGDGFLYNMIRIIVGTVLEIADGRREVIEMKQILEAKDRNVAGPTISPTGLCLERVYY